MLVYAVAQQVGALCRRRGRRARRRAGGCAAWSPAGAPAAQAKAPRGKPRRRPSHSDPHPHTRAAPAPLCPGPSPQVQALATVLAPNQDGAFILSIAWTAVNMYQSNFLMRFADMTNAWLSVLR
jgi:hypothetical protein